MCTRRGDNTIFLKKNPDGILVCVLSLLNYTVFSYGLGPITLFVMMLDCEKVTGQNCVGDQT